MIEFYLIKVSFLATVSFVITILWTPVLTHFLYKYKVGKSIRDSSSAPIFAKLHSKKAGTPTMGGILIWGTTLFLILFFFYMGKFFGGKWEAMNFLSRPETFLPLGVLIASALVGWMDDFVEVSKRGYKGGGLRMWHRVLLYAIIAAVGAWWFYFKLDWTTLHVPFVGDFDIGLWFIPFFILVIVSTAFSVNETDGLDGLAGGVVLMAFASYGAIAFALGRYNLATFCAVIMGALIAFLWFNINPSRFFMGDTGSMPLGITLGVVAILTNYALLLPIIALVLVLESLSVIIQVSSKKIRKKKVFISAPIHHHLEALGWSEPKIVMRFWLIAGVSSVVGMMMFLLDRF